MQRRGYLIITLSQNDQNLTHPSPFVRTCSILVTPPTQANVQNLTSPFTNQPLQKQ